MTGITDFFHTPLSHTTSGLHSFRFLNDLYCVPLGEMIFLVAVMLRVFEMLHFSVYFHPGGKPGAGSGDDVISFDFLQDDGDDDSNEDDDDNNDNDVSGTFNLSLSKSDVYLYESDISFNTLLLVVVVVVVVDVVVVVVVAAAAAAVVVTIDSLECACITSSLSNDTDWIFDGEVMGFDFGRGSERRRCFDFFAAPRRVVGRWEVLFVKREIMPPYEG
jgi:hypothetical protein